MRFKKRKKTIVSFFLFCFFHNNEILPEYFRFYKTLNLT